jgi:hypothetical protein
VVPSGGVPKSRREGGPMGLITLLVVIILVIIILRML